MNAHERMEQQQKEIESLKKQIAGEKPDEKAKPEALWQLIKEEKRSKILEMLDGDVEDIDKSNEVGRTALIQCVLKD